MGHLVRPLIYFSPNRKDHSAMPQILHSWLIILLLAAKVLSQNNCCPERTVLGSDGNSGVYQLTSDSDDRCGDGCLYTKQNSADSSICFQPSSSGSVTSGGPSPSASCPSSTTIAVGHLTLDPGPTVALPLTIWHIQSTINPASISMAGDWGPDEFCPFGAYATGFELKVAPLCSRRCRTDDDFAIGATRLTCAHYLDPDTPVATVTSTVSTAGRL